MAVRIAMKRAVEIRFRCSRPSRFADLELGSLPRNAPGGFAAEVIADDRRGQAFYR